MKILKLLSEIHKYINFHHTITKTRDFIDVPGNLNSIFSILFLGFWFSEERSSIGSKTSVFRPHIMEIYGDDTFYPNCVFNFTLISKFSLKLILNFII